MERVADYIIRKIKEEGVSTVFTVTGRGSLFLNDALAKNPNVKSVSVHHEQSAAFAAVAYSHSTNNTGACLVSSGCASTNAITGVLSAWQDGLACIFISGQNTMKETTSYTGLKIRTYGQQETNIVSILKPITKYCKMLTSSDNIVYEIEKAFHLAKEGNKGPVWIDVPLDLQSKLFDHNKQRTFFSKLTLKSRNLNDDIDFVKKAIDSSKRPIILIGSGIRHSSSEILLEKLISKCKIPLVYSSSAVDTYSTNNELSIGSLGSMGCRRSASFALQNSDLVLVLGSRLNSMTTGSDFCKFARSAKIIVVDINKIEHSKESVNIEKLIISDLNHFLTAILKLDLKQTNKDWIKKCIHWKSAFPVYEEGFKNGELIDLYHLADVISKNLSENYNVITDSGFIELILPSNIKFPKGSKCIHPISQGSMGFALPAILGSYFSDKERSIVSIVGDGSVMMNLQELEAIKYHKIPVKIIVVNNNMYSIIKKRQIDLFRKRTIGTDHSNGISSPSFEKIADCFEFKYFKIKKSKDLESGIENLFKIAGSAICEIYGKEDQNYVHISRAKNENKKIVQRPLEDQSPFIDRELFLKEMIIKAIDQ